MEPVFTSERLLFKQFTEADAPLVYELNRDPEVMKYLHELPTTVDSAKNVIRHIIIPQYEKYNHGRWAVYLKSTAEFIGWCGLKYREDRNLVDLGYRFMQHAWGKGYATEASRRCIDYAFNDLGMTSLFAAAHIDNIASQKVLEKCGFTPVGLETIDNCPANTYQLLSP